MIRYPAADLAALTVAVDLEAPTWRLRAAERTTANIAAGRFVEKSSIWSEVKPIFMRLQHRKCAYCERPLAGELAGLIEQDVEHFRPKGNVRRWPKAGEPAYPFETGPAFPNGYYWLAYALDNYAAACKPCNSTRKSDYFPISSVTRGTVAATPAELNASEQPLLIYPLGTDDDDPEDVITFDGIAAVPVHANGPQHHKAVVTIAFFALNDRDELWVERFRVIREVWTHYDCTQVHPNPAERISAAETLRELVREDAPHASCARSFLRKIESDPLEAYEIFKLARKANRSRGGPA